MPLTALSRNDLDLIGRSLRLMATGNVLEDFEFGARMGVEPAEYRAMVARWPAWDDADDDSSASLAINNTLNDLLHGVGLSEQQCIDQLGVGREELLAVYRRWAASRGWKATGVR